MGELPEYFDEDGYPSGELLEWIASYDNMDLTELIEVVKGAWTYDSYFIFKRKWKSKRTLELHTGGWSGNESIIHALKSNMYFWICWKKSYAGGHHYFSIHEKRLNPNPAEN